SLLSGWPRCRFAPERRATTSHSRSNLLLDSILVHLVKNVVNAETERQLKCDNDRHSQSGQIE
ncbi:MAG: hypothetical protein ABI583_10840, partial [Betaproteobacteria bacterium]